MNTTKSAFTTTVPKQRYTSEGERLEVVAPNWAKGTPVYIRDARKGRAETVHETAARLGVTRSAVHRAISYDGLNPDDREAITQEFLSQRLVKDIAYSRGIGVSAVLETLRVALVHARVEAAMAIPV